MRVIINLLLSIFIIYNTNEDITIFNNTIDGLGTFNTTNVTNFTMNDSSNDVQIDYVGNDTIAQVTTTSSSSNVEITTAECHTIYKYAATIGEHKGDVRYISFLKDNDKNRYIMVSS